VFGAFGIRFGFRWFRPTALYLETPSIGAINLFNKRGWPLYALSVFDKKCITVGITLITKKPPAGPMAFLYFFFNFS